MSGLDPRDVFLDGLDLPRGHERQIVLDGDRTYEINGDESRTLAATGAFRVVSERDLRDPRDASFDARDNLRHLREQELVRTVSLDGRERAVTLTPRGRRLLETHRRDRDDESGQVFHAGVSRPRELIHDASLYGAYLQAEERLREQGGEVRRVVLEHDLKREYQLFLQEHNRGRSDSDGRPGRDLREIEEWAHERDLPYFDDHVRFPDFGLSKRCSCPRRLWTKGCSHSWHYAFMCKGQRYRDAVDNVLGRHVDSKTEALREVEKIFDAVREGRFGTKPAALLTLRELGEVYFEKYLSPKTGRPLGPNERYLLERHDGHQR